jgi:DNA-binding Lrp family transcriptional regulator
MKKYKTLGDGVRQYEKDKSKKILNALVENSQYYKNGKIPFTELSEMIGVLPQYILLLISDFKKKEIIEVTIEEKFKKSKDIKNYKIKLTEMGKIFQEFSRDFEKIE